MNLTCNHGLSKGFRTFIGYSEDDDEIMDWS
jgi:hypothetical protein